MISGEDIYFLVRDGGEFIWGNWWGLELFEKSGGKSNEI